MTCHDCDAPTGADPLECPTCQHTFCAKHYDMAEGVCLGCPAPVDLVPEGLDLPDELEPGVRYGGLGDFR